MPSKANSISDLYIQYLKLKSLFTIANLGANKYPNIPGSSGH